MTEPIYELLLARLTAEDGPPDAVADLVLAAADGDAVLGSLLEGSDAPVRRASQSADVTEPARVYLEEVAVEGFRGIAGRARLQLETGPGLTLVVGRNGSGKSSFAEALEVLLTGETTRWKDRPKVWRDGWRNLHHDGPTIVESTFRVAGESQPLVIRQRWAEGADVDECDDRELVGGPALETWADLGWDVPLSRYRPLLSYAELGSMFSERSKELYLALAAVLGLEPFEEVNETLRQARLGLGQSAKQEAATRKSLKQQLETVGHEDPRAGELLQLIAKRPPDPDAVEHLLHAPAAGDDTQSLTALVRVPLPSPEQIDAVYAELDAATASVSRLDATDAARTDALARLLDHAIGFHADHVGDDRTCPVCHSESVLDEGWSLRAQADLDAARQASADLRAARTELEAADAHRAQLFDPSTPAVLRAAALNLDDVLLGWDQWVSSPTRDNARGLERLLRHVRGDAEAELLVRDADWRPVADATAVWVKHARDAARDKEQVTRLEAAEAWMKTLLEDLRVSRLAPVVDAAQANWELLRHSSNVHLGAIALKASGPQKSVTFDVQVDGADASAFGVMSQGELTSLAISVFLPRAALPESPFGFMVIDDPVQSMDPAKVDGLAKVLAAAAMKRQVIVFTHDERLPQAIERLAIEARTIRVHRRAASKVELVAGAPPSERYLQDAHALHLTEGLSDDVKARVVPGFCRSAIESACATRIRRRRLGAGESHSEVEAGLLALTTLNTWLAEALEIPIADGAAIRQKVEQLGGPGATAVIKLVSAGAHGPVNIDGAMLGDTKRLVRALEAR